MWVIVSSLVGGGAELLRQDMITLKSYTPSLK